jgi:hypothetical protein
MDERAGRKPGRKDHGRITVRPRFDLDAELLRILDDRRFGELSALCRAARMHDRRPGAA